jgi:hypothetical protein
MKISRFKYFSQVYELFGKLVKKYLNWGGGLMQLVAYGAQDVYLKNL